MASLSFIKDRKLQKILAAIREHTELVQSGERGYVRKVFIKLNERLVKRFAKYIKKRNSREVDKIVKRYDLDEDTLRKDSGLPIFERVLIGTYEQNVNLAFARATNTIERSLKLQRTNPGNFGVFALLGLTRKRPKLEDPVKAEGLSRLTRKGNLWRLQLAEYLIMLTRTAQEEWERKLGEAIAIEVGVDLMRISDEKSLVPDRCEVCNKWRDRIVSRSGSTPGFPFIGDAVEKKYDSFIRIVDISRYHLL